MSRIVALDTETTGLDPDTEDVFEVAAIDLATGDEFVWRLPPRPEVVAAMHPKAAEVNRYHERTAADDWRWDHDPHRSLLDIGDVLEGAHLLGAVPDFDARHLTATYRRAGLPVPLWHYHLLDIEAMAVGWLVAHARDFNRQACGDDALVAAAQEVHDLATTLPWRSDDLSRACGVEPPTDDERHTAAGDARWVARWYRALTGDA